LYYFGIPSNKLATTLKN